MDTSNWICYHCEKLQGPTFPAFVVVCDLGNGITALSFCTVNCLQSWVRGEVMRQQEEASAEVAV